VANASTRNKTVDLVASILARQQRAKSGIAACYDFLSN
jgi:hypothetical protein